MTDTEKGAAIVAKAIQNTSEAEVDVKFKINVGNFKFGVIVQEGVYFYWQAYIGRNKWEYPRRNKKWKTVKGAKNDLIGTLKSFL